MKNNVKLVIIVLCLSMFFSCSSEEERKLQYELERKEQITAKEQANARLREKAIQDSLDEVRLEKERKEKAIYDKYINNRLSNGATPYAYLYGNNKSCSGLGCSHIKVTSPNSSDVIVIIKRNNKVVKHAYIRASNSYTFEMADGTYQPFFYYGKGWNPDKVMKETEKGILKGGFVDEELFSKDYPQTLKNQILEYTLVLQLKGNFETKPSSKEEVF